MLRAKSDVVVRLDEAERGSIPARCARTGKPCITRVRLWSSDLHPALEWATWSDLWPWRRPQGRHPVVVSLLPGKRRRRRVLQVSRDVTAALVPLLLLASLLAGGAARSLLLGVLLVVIGLKAVVGIAGMTLTVRVRMGEEPGWVRLCGVDPETAALIEARTSRPVTGAVDHDEGRRLDVAIVRPVQHTGALVDHGAAQHNLAARHSGATGDLGAARHGGDGGTHRGGFRHRRSSKQPARRGRHEVVVAPSSDEITPSEE